MLRVLLALLLPMLVLGTAEAQTPSKRVRGEILTSQEGQITVKERGGQTLQINLKDPLTVNAVVKADVAKVAAGSYVGIAAVPQSDGGLKALEVLIFPDAMRGAGEGHSPWDLTPETTMTNAAVESVVSEVSGRTLKLKYKDGEKTITVPPDAPVVTFEPSDRSLLKAGNHVFLSAATQPDGSLSASRIAVGRDGLVPPM